MAKGNLAKDNVANKIASAFGSDYIGTYDKKYYVWADENGEKIQVAISLTCPKTPISITTGIPMTSAGFNFEDDAPAVTVTAPTTVPEITEQERENIATLMARLGL